MDPQVAIDDVAGALVDEDVLDPADLIEHPASASCWAFGWTRKFAGLASS